MAKAVLIILLFVQFIFADFTRTVTAGFQGGIPDCQICGTPGSYACSNGQFGDWNDGILYFQDPLNATEAPLYTATSVTATVYGNFGCDKKQGNTVDVKLELAGNILQIRQVPSDLSNQCACGTCTSYAFTSIYNGGLPNYKTGSQNKLRISVIKNFVCVNRVELRFTYTNKAPRNWLYATFDNFYTKGGENCAYCGDYGKFTCNDDSNWTNNRTLNLSFNDPLPRGAVLYMANVTMVGAYDCTKQYSGTDTVSVTLQETKITDSNVGYPGGWNCLCSSTNNAVGCNNPVTFNTQRGYPTGWPQYNYGGVNVIQLTTPSAPSSRFCLSRIDVAFTVYFKGKIRNYNKKIVIQ